MTDLVVDLGCGWIKYPATVAKPKLNLPSVIGVDVCRYNNDIVGCALYTPLKNEIADMVVLRQFIEHVDSQTLVQEAWRILKPNGKLLVETPNALWFFRILRALRGMEANPYPEHIQIFSAPELRNILRRNGFKNTVISYHNVPVGNPNAILAWVKKCVVAVQGKLFPMLSREVIVFAIKDGSAIFEGYN